MGMKKMSEKSETPRMEAESHSKQFLKKALSAKSADKIRAKVGKQMSAAGAAY